MNEQVKLTIGQAFTRPSVVALIFSNLLPIIGVMLLDWRLAEITFIYWLETIIIGVFNIAKLFFILVYDYRSRNKIGPTKNRDGSNFVLPFFFLVHYGMFNFVHGSFLNSFFWENLNKNSSYVFFAIFIFGLSHLIAFIWNFVINKEYIGKSINKQMFEPYKRVIVIHLFIFFAAFVAMHFTSLWPYLIFIGIKLFLDLKSHLKLDFSSDDSIES